MNALTTRRAARLLTAVTGTAVVAALVGCSQASAPTDATSGESAASISIAISAPPQSLDPAQLSDGQGTFVSGAIYQNLVYRENNTGAIKPWAAESWKFSDSGKSLTFTLRKGMKFSDGKPITATDVVATMTRTKNTPGAQQAKYAAVTDISAPDAHTVAVSFSAYDPSFLPTLAQSAGVVAEATNLESKSISTDPVSSGPYTLDSGASVPGTSYVLHRRADYWDAKSFPFKTLTVKVLQDPAAALNAFRAGDINAATIQAPQKGVITAISGAKVGTSKAQALAVINVFDPEGKVVPALKDAKVRQAISYAIDRKGILKALFSGNGQATTQVFSPLGKVYDKSLDDAYAFDPKKAKQLLAEAGYGDGLSLDIPSTFLTTTVEPTLSQEFGAVGIKLNWVPLAPQQADGAGRSGKFGIGFQFIGFSADEVNAANMYGIGGAQNPENYTDATLTETFKSINTTVDATKAVSYYKQLNQYAVKQSLQIPIASINSLWATRDGVTLVDNGAAGIQSVRLFGVDSTSK